MGRFSHRQSQSQPSRRGGRSGVAVNAELERLSEQFAEFRRYALPYTRIPNELRAEVVNAAQRGVSNSSLQRCCGVSPAQLARWRRLVDESEALLPAPRVLTVVDTEVAASSPAPARSQGARDGAQPRGFELRLDGWSITVRALEP